LVKETGKQKRPLKKREIWKSLKTLEYLAPFNEFLKETGQLVEG